MLKDFLKTLSVDVNASKLNLLRTVDDRVDWSTIGVVNFISNDIVGTATTWILNGVER